MYDIGYIILNYNTEKITKSAINFIRKIKYQNYKIYLIDNASSNNDGKTLYNYYKNDKDIEFIQNKINIGFANGNNIGYKLARKECTFICILNSDVFIYDESFFIKLKKTFDEYNYTLLGPKIYTKSGDVNPLMKKFENYQKERFYLFKKRFYMYISYLGLNRLREYFSEKRSKLIKIKNRNENDQPYNQFQKNIVLHGCCLIFSPLYLSNFDEAFDTRTFLYGEENLLFLKLRRNNHTIIYDPNITIHHIESQSTKSIRKYKRDCMMWKYTVHAQKLLVRELQNE